LQNYFSPSSSLNFISTGNGVTAALVIYYEFRPIFSLSTLCMLLAVLAGIQKTVQLYDVNKW